MMGRQRWPRICYGDDGAGSAPAASGWRPATNPSLAVSIGIQPLLSVPGQGIWGCLLPRWTSTPATSAASPSRRAAGPVRPRYATERSNLWDAPPSPCPSAPPRRRGPKPPSAPQQLVLA
ncbi:hypothetical protein ACQJBY_007928 [Aegilops geniculata]